MILFYSLYLNIQMGYWFKHLVITWRKQLFISQNLSSINIFEYFIFINKPILEPIQLILHLSSNSQQDIPVMKKLASHRKALHFHFDEMQELPTQELQQVSISEKIMKRQNQILQEERHEAIVKKSKKDQLQGSSRIQSHQQTQDIAAIGSSIIEGKKESSKISKEEQQQFEIQALKLLTEFLLHPNRSNPSIINSEIANEWILQPYTCTKLRSYLMLYMILYQFEEIQFKFTKRHGVDRQKYHKQLLIEKKAKIVVDQDFDENDLYEKFKQNQMRKYLSEYLEWLIEKKREVFEIGEGNVEFWALAMNKAEELALQLMKGKSLRQKTRNFFLSNFLMNAECPLYCSTLDRPKHEKIIFAMKKEDLESLPLCHWILGVNFSVKYFFKKPLHLRIRQSLNPNNIDKDEIQQFYHEYQLLCRYFDQSLPSNNELHKQNVGDLLLQWMTSESVDPYKTQAQAIELSKIICQKLLQKALNVSKLNLFETQSLISTAFELLQRQTTLSVEKKDFLISQILYSKNGVAVKLGKDYPRIISRIEQTKCAQMPQLFQTLNMKYNSLYRHLILSQQQSIKNDFLAQFKHLTEIDMKTHDKKIEQRINQILTSFNLITHWNNNVLKTFVCLIQKYLQKLENSINEKVQNHQELEKLSKEINCLMIFLKIHLRLLPFNFFNLQMLCKFITQGLQKSLMLKFEQKTLNFMKKDLLSRLFTKNQLNESLFAEIKKNSKQQPNLQNQPKKIIVLDKLAQFSRGINYFENQIQLLKKQASLMSI